MKILFTFPGQGTQRAGMLQHLPEGDALKSRVRAVLGDEADRLDSADALRHTRAVQLCLLISGVAWARELIDRVPFFWTTQYGTRYEYVGHAAEWDEFQLIGSLEDKKFMAFYGQQGRLAAICSCGMYTLTAELVERMQQPMTFADAVALCQAHIS